MARLGRHLASVCLAATFFNSAHAAVIHDSALSWQTLHGKHFIVHYHDGADVQAREVMAIAERVHTRLVPFLQWEPRQPTEVVVSDEFDLSNGSATPFPANRITLWLAPPDELNTLEAHAGWIETVLQHEYTHILHLDKARGFPRVVRSIFGRTPSIFPNVFPNAFQPLWLIEGLAVYAETDRNRGIGRGQTSLFDMYMRMEIEGGIKPLAQINQEVDTWPAGVVPYLYGVQFYNHLAARYGDDKVQRWVENYSDRVVPYRISNNSLKTVGRPLDRAWDEFARERTEHYGKQVAAIRARGEHAGEQLTRDGYYASQTRVLPDGTVLYVAFDGRSHPALMVLRPGETKPKRLAEVQRSARLDVHPSAGALIAQPERCRNARLTYDLYRVRLRDGDVTRLTRCARYRQAAWHPDGNRIAAVQHQLGRSRLDLLDGEGKFRETLWEGTSSEVIGDIDWSPDGTRLVASVWRRASGWNLELYSLAERRWRALTRDATIEMQPRFARNGASVLYTSDHGGIYNLRRLDLASGTTTTLTNVVGGAFYPTESASGMLYYIGYGPRGFDLFRAQPAILPLPAAPVRTAARDEPPVAAFPATATVEKYTPWRGLQPRWWAPHLVVETDRTEVGAITAGADALFRHLYLVDAAYDFSVHSFVGRLDYNYDRWWPVVKLHAARDNDFERANNDDVTRVRHSDSYIGEVMLPWLTLDTRFSLHAGVSVDKESDGRRFGTTAARAPTNDARAGLAAIWDSTNRWPLSVSRTEGRELRLVAEDSEAFSGDYTGKIYTLDWREFVALGGEHVLALRFAEGWGTDNPRPFELGGTRGSSQAPALLGDVSLDTPFNVRRYPLRGYPDGLNVLTGRRVQLGTLEWRFPIRRVERGFMSPPLALHQLAGALFVDNGGVWNDGRSPDDRRTGAGVELHADAAILYSLRFNVRLGYAHGFDQNGENQVYLRIGSSF
jgi:hypothetical protein